MNFHFVLGLVEDSARRPDGGGDVLHRVTEPDLLGQAGGLHTTVNMWSKVLLHLTKSFLDQLDQFHRFILCYLAWSGGEAAPGRLPEVRLQRHRQAGAPTLAPAQRASGQTEESCEYSGPTC